MKTILLSILTLVFITRLSAQTGEVTEDDQGIALNLFFDINIPSGYIFTPTLNYRTQLRPLNRPIHFFFNPYLGMVKTPDSKRIDPVTGQIIEGSKKVHLGIAPQLSVGYPIFYSSKYKIANVLKGTDFESNGLVDKTTYFVQQGLVPTHQALLAEIGYSHYPVYDSYGPSVFYGLRWYITQKGKVEDSSDGGYYNVKAVMSLYLYLYNRLSNDEVFENIPENNLRRTGYKFGVDFTRGGKWGMTIAIGGCPGRRDAYGGTSFVLGYLDIGVYKVIGLWKSPL
jgi:hypothetical protein